jgi:hypothetical protein
MLGDQLQHRAYEDAAKVKLQRPARCVGCAELGLTTMYSDAEAQFCFSFIYAFSGTHLPVVLSYL